MAAHSLTILNESKQKLAEGSLNRDLLVHALEYAPGMDELDFDTWKRLHDALTDGCDGCVALAIDVALDEQRAEWHELQGPKTHEEWFNRKYPSA